MLLMLTAVICCSAQIGMPAGWVKTDPPAGSWEGEDSKLLCADYSHKVWRVEFGAQDQLQVTNVGDRPFKDEKVVFPPRFVRTKKMIGQAVVARPGDGWLIGFDGGEFGGGLWWSNSDGSKTQALTDENVNSFIRRGQELLVLTGLAHGSFDRGTLYSYRTATGKPGTLVKTSDLGSAPAATLLQSDGTLFIAGHRRILKVDHNNRTQDLYENENIGMMNPLSISTDRKGSIFIGMRFYVLALQLRPDSSYEPVWFMRSNCLSFKIRDLDCVCTGTSKNK